MDKSPEAFRTISEVAEDLDLPQHVLRFWETRFSQIKPMKRGGGRRYYRPDDVDLLRGIRHLLYGHGFTIRGVQKILREQGVRHVMTIWRDDVVATEIVSTPSAFDEDEVASAATDAVEPRLPLGRTGERPSGGHPVLSPAVRAPRPVAEASLHDIEASEAFDDEAETTHPGEAADESGAEPPVAFRTDVAPPVHSPELRAEAPARPAPRPAPAVHPVAEHHVEGHERAPAKPVVARSVAEVVADNAPRLGLIERLRGHDRPGEHAGLSREDVRRLQATVFELLECKRLLDQAR